MHTKTLIATALLHPAQFISLVKATVNTLIAGQHERLLHQPV